MPAHSAWHRPLFPNFCRQRWAHSVRVGSWEGAHFKLEGSPEYKCRSHLPTEVGAGGLSSSQAGEKQHYHPGRFHLTSLHVWGPFFPFL